MKKDIFIIKALESKGYTLDKVLAMTDDQIQKLSVPNRVITEILDYKARGATPVEVIAEKSAEVRRIDDSTVTVAPEVIEQYVQDTEEQVSIQDEVNAEALVLDPIKEDEVEIVREVADKEDLQIIKDALQDKELKTFAAYTKHLKTVVPESILADVDSTVISSLIDERIAEVKNTK